MSKENEAPKQPYEAPRLKDFGPVEKLTKGQLGTLPDSGAGSSHQTAPV